MNRSEGTRERILRAAEQLFVEGGYHTTALQEIADRLGITKAALYYHFSSKTEILDHLLEPMTVELEQALAQAEAEEESGGIVAVRTRLMTDWVDIFLRYRGTVLALMRGLASTPSESFARLLRVMEGAIEAASDAEAGVGDRVALAQAISAIADPAALIPDLSDEVLREHLLAGAWRLLGLPRSGGGVRRGRPRAVSASDVALVRELHASGEHSAESIAERLGVSRATVYRHLKT